MKEKNELEINEDMIGATDAKTCCTAFADPFIAKQEMQRLTQAESPVKKALCQEKRQGKLVSD